MKEDKRTEEEIVSTAPIVVILGGKEHEIAPLVIKHARVWRPKVRLLLNPIPKHLASTSDEPDSYEAALDEMLVNMPDVVIDLFFEYAKDLNREEIEGTASEAELAVAWGKVMEVGFPLSRSLPKTLKKLSR